MERKGTDDEGVERGILVTTTVDPPGTLGIAGVQKGDAVLALNGVDVENYADLRREVRSPRYSSCRCVRFVWVSFGFVNVSVHSGVTCVSVFVFQRWCDLCRFRYVCVCICACMRCVCGFTYAFSACVQVLDGVISRLCVCDAACTWVLLCPPAHLSSLPLSHGPDGVFFHANMCIIYRASPLGFCVHA